MPGFPREVPSTRIHRNALRYTGYLPRVTRDLSSCPVTRGFLPTTGNSKHIFQEVYSNSQFAQMTVAIDDCVVGKKMPHLPAALFTRRTSIENRTIQSFLRRSPSGNFEQRES